MTQGWEDKSRKFSPYNAILVAYMYMYTGSGIRSDATRLCERMCDHCLNREGFKH